MKLNVKAMAKTSALVWGGAVLTVGVANLLQPRYGKAFLRLVASIYPGYRPRPAPRQIAVGTAYAVVDGAVGGALFAWLYNQLLPDPQATGLGRHEQHVHAAPEVKAAV